MLESMVIATVVARIRGLKLKPMLRYWGTYPLFFACLLILFNDIMLLCNGFWILGFSRALNIIFIIGVVCFFLGDIRNLLLHCNLKLIVTGAVLCVMSIIFNKAAMYVNGGKMPAYPTLSNLLGTKTVQVGIERGEYIFCSTSVKLWFLSDIFDVGYNIYSLGDILFYITFGFLTYTVIKMRNNIAVKKQDVNEVMVEK